MSESIGAILDDDTAERRKETRHDCTSARNMSAPESRGKLASE